VNSSYVEKLLKLQDRAKQASVSQRPGEGKDPAYQLGWFQGVYEGLAQALVAVNETLDETAKRERLL
jgi:hypothetical protein